MRETSFASGLAAENGCPVGTNSSETRKSKHVDVYLSQAAKLDK